MANISILAYVLHVYGLLEATVWQLQCIVELLKVKVKGLGLSIATVTQYVSRSVLRVGILQVSMISRAAHTVAYDRLALST
jgi:hypothetical protein